MSLRSEAKNSKRKEAKRSEKSIFIFHVSVRNACETDLVSLQSDEAKNFFLRNRRTLVADAFLRRHIEQTWNQQLKGYPHGIHVATCELGDEGQVGYLDTSPSKLEEDDEATVVKHLPLHRCVPAHH